MGNLEIILSLCLPKMWGQEVATTSPKSSKLSPCFENVIIVFVFLCKLLLVLFFQVLNTSKLVYIMIVEGK